MAKQNKKLMAEIINGLKQVDEVSQTPSLVQVSTQTSKAMVKKSYETKNKIEERSSLINVKYFLTSIMHNKDINTKAWQLSS